MGSDIKSQSAGWLYEPKEVTSKTIVLTSTKAEKTTIPFGRVDYRYLQTGQQ